jgi:hypothetical protein
MGIEGPFISKFVGTVIKVLLVTTDEHPVLQHHNKSAARGR